MKHTVQVINTLEILGFLKTNGTQCRFVGLTIKTPVVKIKAGNPWNAGKKTESGLYKVSRKIGIINADYVKSVESRIATAHSLPTSAVEYTPGKVWYRHLTTAEGKSLPVAEHTDEAKRGQYYMQYFPHKNLSECYVNEAGEVVPDKTVTPWLYAESERSEYKPAVIVVKLSNIMEIKASGVIVQSSEFEEAAAALTQA